MEQQIIAERQPTIVGNRTNASRKALIAVTTMYVKPKLREDLRLFEGFVPYALGNMLDYCNHHGYPFFFYHSTEILDAQDKTSMYWSKLSILEHYLDKGRDFYNWILWTDIDVYFLKRELPLHVFTEPVPDKYHMIGVLECGRNDPIYLASSIRSGFFFIRNSAQGRELLRVWRDLEANFRASPTPEQRALQYLFLFTPLRDWIYLFPTRNLHAYQECVEDETFSVHFNNRERKLCMKQWRDQLFPHIKPVFM
jgi:hypothetical protein